jgi:hypothetical protein
MRTILLVFLALSLFSCKNNKDEKQGQQASISTADTLPYFDASAEVLKELAFIKSDPRFLFYKITEQQGKKDSVAIDTLQLTQLAAPFYEVQINRPDIKKQYKETLFPDPDTKSYVYDYKTSNPNLPVKSIVVLTDNEKQNFKRVDMLKSYRRNDTLFDERLAWTVGKKFQVIQIATIGNKELTKQTYVYWRERK